MLLQVKLVGSNPSYMWRSIMAAQDVVRQGSRRRIGDGETTSVWKIPELENIRVVMDYGH